jgi:hydrogenase maturation protein HypF
MATLITVTGVVQGVGFRPFIHRKASSAGLNGWVINNGLGVVIYLEENLSRAEILEQLLSDPPPAARIDEVIIEPTSSLKLSGFTVRESDSSGTKRAEIPIDLAICEDCRRELFDSTNRRHLYPYINCTNCGPRWSVVLSLPYDRPNTTMKDWSLCQECEQEYQDPLDRRFHAEPIACPACGPHFLLYQNAPDTSKAVAEGVEAIQLAAKLIADGKIVAIKGIGGYLLACDALNQATLTELRSRKFRREKPFALMAKDLQTARKYVQTDTASEIALSSPSAPIVLLPAKRNLDLVAPGTDKLGVMLPYAPVHLLLFEFGAPELLVMTSGNRSSEPMIYQDDIALAEFRQIADAVLVGQRPIARRIDDSVLALDDKNRLVFMRRARGYAPAKTSQGLLSKTPVLACGADLKSTITLVTDSGSLTSPYLGDLSFHEVQQAHTAQVEDFLTLFDIPRQELAIVTDAHPDYHSNRLAHRYSEIYNARPPREIQHHRAHIASVLVEHGLFDERVVALAMDGVGYGDDGSIWGGEFFYGSLRTGFARVASLESSLLVGGDAAAKIPLQCLRGFVDEQTWLWFSSRVPDRKLVNQIELSQRIVTFPTTSAGRLFDSVAAICGFLRPSTFEGQAASWLESLARSALKDGYTPLASPLLTWNGRHIRYRDFLASAAVQVEDTKSAAALAADFHESLACAISNALVDLSKRYETKRICLSGGVFQNLLLRELLQLRMDPSYQLLYNEVLSCNDENISVGQAALAIFSHPGN